MLMLGDAMSILRAQHHAPLCVFASAHFAKQPQRFGNRPVAVRRVAADLRQRAAIGANVVGALLVDVRVSGFDQVFGEAIHVLEVIARVIQIRFSPCSQSKPIQRTDSRIESTNS